MRKYCILIFIIFLAISAQSQIIPSKTSGFNKGAGIKPSDTLYNKKMINVKLTGKTKYTDYKIISYKNDSTFIDTTLSIQKRPCIQLFTTR